MWTEIFHLGVPVAGLVFLEAGLFIAVAVLSGLISVNALAACQIVMGWIGVPFVMAFGVANATMVRVAQGIGRGSWSGARTSGLLGIASGCLMITLLVVVPVSMPLMIVNWFLDPADPGYANVSTLVESLLPIVACFQLFDGLQSISAHALRGLRDTLFPLWAAALGYWVIGITGGSVMAFALDFGMIGLWLGLASGLCTTGCLLTWRFLTLSDPRMATSHGL